MFVYITSCFCAEISEVNKHMSEMTEGNPKFLITNLHVSELHHDHTDNQPAEICITDMKPMYEDIIRMSLVLPLQL